MSPRTEVVNKRIRDERREQILLAAVRVFAHKGLSATKITDIAAAAGISQGLIHHYFDSKESVFTAAAELAIVSGMDATIAAIESTDQQPWDRLVAIYEKWLESINSKPQYDHLLMIVQCLINEDIPPGTRELVAKHGHTLFLNFVQLIRDGQAAEQIIAGHPEELAFIFISTIQGLVLTQLTRQIFSNDPDYPQSGAMPRAETVLRLLKA